MEWVAAFTCVLITNSAKLGDYGESSIAFYASSNSGYLSAEDDEILFPSVNQF